MAKEYEMWQADSQKSFMRKENVAKMSFEKVVKW